jgi:hypothetical protein
MADVRARKEVVPLENLGVHTPTGPAFPLCGEEYREAPPISARRPSLQPDQEPPVETQAGIGTFRGIAIGVVLALPFWAWVVFQLRN